ncbi:hypothetical protein JCM19000A_28130 [Silvimonas sp. JCM 19000]
MDRLGVNMVYRCGHKAQPGLPVPDTHDASLMRIAFSCPHCLSELARRYVLDTRIFVNLQQLSPGMSAFVIEVADAVEEVGEMLAAVGYGCTGKSQDELTPGMQTVVMGDQVWRKELWFANNTDPRHVVALIAHVKSEMVWLEPYLPMGQEAIEYCTFPV